MCHIQPPTHTKSIFIKCSQFAFSGNMQRQVGTHDAIWGHFYNTVQCYWWVLKQATFVANSNSHSLHSEYTQRTHSIVTNIPTWTFYIGDCYFKLLSVTMISAPGHSHQLRLSIRLRDLSLPNEYRLVHCGLSAASKHKLASTSRHYSLLTATTALYLTPSLQKISQSKLIFKAPTTSGVPPSHILTNLIINIILDANVDRKSPSIQTVNG